jgi:hypothetical protein
MFNKFWRRVRNMGIHINSQNGMNVSSHNGVTIINGKKYTGNNVSINGSTIIIDGKVVDTHDGKQLEIIITGGPVSVNAAEGNVTVNGNVEGDVNAAGSVKCHDVGKNVKASGSVTAGDVQGDVDASGSVHCGKVGGNASAMGSMHRG